MNFDFDLIPKARNPKLYIKTINFFPYDLKLSKHKGGTRSLKLNASYEFGSTK